MGSYPGPGTAYLTMLSLLFIFNLENGDEFYSPEVCCEEKIL